MEYNFEWDPVKAASNYDKHRVSFERASEVFLDPFMLSIFDEEHSEDEERWITTGKDCNNVTLVVIHTFRETLQAQQATVRIISARKATNNEDKQYHSR
ncbi:MAG: BrnT family toxin [Bacteroidetes bacterium]|nr:MAG: BrnT family toxin [Bacteroidota bacterium]